jgi:hypothetical protein
MTRNRSPQLPYAEGSASMPSTGASIRATRSETSKQSALRGILPPPVPPSLSGMPPAASRKRQTDPPPTRESHAALYIALQTPVEGIIAPPYGADKKGRKTVQPPTQVVSGFGKEIPISWCMGPLSRLP